MFDQVFLLPQVKRSRIIHNKHGVYEFHRRKLENIKKIKKNHNIFATGRAVCPHKKKKENLKPS